jgi:hypothetical protein
MNQLATLCHDGHWLPIRDGDARGRALFRRHYSWEASHKRTNSPKFVGPGEYLMLLTPDALALFVWRAERFRRDDQTGINCAVFRNEGPVRSSVLIREACDLAWARWPGERLYTFVNPARVRSANPGYCFLAAEWRRCGRSAEGLLILERLWALTAKEGQDGE